MAEEQTVSVDKISTFINRSDRYVQKLAKAGIIPKAAHGKYPFFRAIRAYIDHLHTEAEQRSKDPEGYEETEILDKDQEQARSAREDWIRKQRENAVADGLLLDREEHRLALSQTFQALATVLETLPDYVEREAGLSPEQAEAMQKAVDRQRVALVEAIDNAE